MTKTASIYITETDQERLSNLIKLVRDRNDRAHSAYIKVLEEGLEFAEVVAPRDIPPNVITMRSRARLRDLETGEESVYTIVFPTEADLDEGRISILAPLATALLGRRLGEVVEIQAPSRLRRMRVEELIYQPELAGDYDL